MKLMNPPAKPVFRTKRLYVYQLDIKPPQTLQRAVFFGVLKHDELPWPVVTATVLLFAPYTSHTLQSIWTMEWYQQTGYAKELWLGIEKFLDRAVGPGALVSDAGKALASSVERARPKSRERFYDSDDPQFDQQLKDEFMQAHRGQR